MGSYISGEIIYSPDKDQLEETSGMSKESYIIVFHSNAKFTIPRSHKYSRIFFGIISFTRSIMEVTIKFKMLYQLENLQKRKKINMVSNTVQEITCPANIYLFKFNNKNTRKSCEIWSKLTIKTAKMTSFWFFYC